MEDDKIPNFLLPLSPEEKKKAKEYAIRTQGLDFWSLVGYISPTLSGETPDWPSRTRVSLV